VSTSGNGAHAGSARLTERPPRLTVQVTTASFQGTRYRIECEHPACGSIVATLPPDTAPSLIGPGSRLELARSGSGPVHVLGESLPRARAEAELAAAAS